MDFLEVNLLTKHDLLYFISELKESTDIDSLSVKIDANMFRLFLEEFKTKNNNFEETKKHFVRLLNNTKDIKVYLAFAPSRVFLKKLYTSIFQNIYKGDFVMDLIVDEKILGGIKLVIDGKVFDSTLEFKLNSFVNTR